MKVLDTIHGRIVNVDIDVDSDYDGDIDDADEPLEETQGGFVGVGAENLTPIRLSFGPLLAQLPGKLTLSATKGGDKIRIWKDAQRTTAVPLPKVWQNGVQIPPTLYVEGVTPSANVRDVELTLEYDEVPEGTPQNKQYLFKCSDKIALTVVKIEMITPSGDPVNAPVSSGDGQNEFTYSTATPGVLTMNLKARVTPDVAGQIAHFCFFTVGHIHGAQLAWDVANPGGRSAMNEGQLLATVFFTGLPANNSSFGKKKATLLMCGIKQDEKEYEVFYDGLAKNHPGMDTGITPNWFFYYQQVVGGDDYHYAGIPICTMICEGNGFHDFNIGENAYYTSRDIVTEVIDGWRIATSWTPEFFGLGQFINTINHEREHSKTCPCKTQDNHDTDRDALVDTFEHSTSLTDQLLRYSARDNGILSAVKMDDYYDDGELWARHKGITATQAADVSEDWANPGGNNAQKSLHFDSVQNK